MKYKLLKFILLFFINLSNYLILFNKNKLSKLDYVYSFIILLVPIFLFVKNKQLIFLAHLIFMWILSTLPLITTNKNLLLISFLYMIGYILSQIILNRCCYLTYLQTNIKKHIPYLTNNIFGKTAIQLTIGVFIFGLIKFFTSINKYKKITNTIFILITIIYLIQYYIIYRHPDKRFFIDPNIKNYF